MAMMPKRIRWRKEQRRRIRGLARRGNRVSFGEFGLMSLEHGRLSGRVIEAGRIAMSHFLGSDGKIWIRIFPHKPYTSTPAETRMGKGKGEPEYYAAIVKPGTILFEVGGGVPEDVAREALLRAAHKMPVRVRMVKRKGVA